MRVHPDGDCHEPIQHTRSGGGGLGYMNRGIGSDVDRVCETITIVEGEDNGGVFSDLKSPGSPRPEMAAAYRTVRVVILRNDTRGSPGPPSTDQSNDIIAHRAYFPYPSCIVALLFTMS
jgi:hypothetical protein